MEHLKDDGRRVEKTVETGTRPRYTAPRIVHREELELRAGACAKVTDPPCNSQAGPVPNS